jgi:signal transduction histidine kinase
MMSLLGLPWFEDYHAFPPLERRARTRSVFVLDLARRPVHIPLLAAQKLLFKTGMSVQTSNQMHALCDHLASRRKVILRDWRSAVKADPGQETARALTRSQFNDHVPNVLDAFDRKLRSLPDPGDAEAADQNIEEQELKHGLHRWQQGYRLQELVEEWGHLQLCLFRELEDFAEQSPDFTGQALRMAKEQLLLMVNESIAASAGQYERMQQEEAVASVNALKQTLDRVHEIERQRAALIHQMVHDLRNNVSNVDMAARLLGEDGIALDDRMECAALLRQGIQGVTAMLSELMELARLEAGLERRELAVFDVATLAREVCDLHRPFARERKLGLATEGGRLSVESDAALLRRLLQNLLHNALKYTVRGGVLVSWGEESANWWLMVKDTGPGLSAGAEHSSPMAANLQEATKSARESDELSARQGGRTSPGLSDSEETAAVSSPPDPHSGEGVGLSIVKRLCELLDASLEMTTEDNGTTFCVRLPKRYTQR